MITLEKNALHGAVRVTAECGIAVTYLWRSAVVLIVVDFQPDDLSRGNTSRTAGHRVHQAHVQQPHHVSDVFDAEVDDVDERGQGRVFAGRRCPSIGPVRVGRGRQWHHIRFDDTPIPGPGGSKRAQRERDAGPEARGHDYHAPGSCHLKPTVNDSSWVVRTVPHQARAQQVVIVTPVHAARQDGHSDQLKQKQQQLGWSEGSGGDACMTHNIQNHSTPLAIFECES